ncbi:ABC transporter substrate-binding protein [Corynebacterium sp. ES2794-CONJ1]|nr:MULTISPECIES: ABC transporter substrate-binding protein [unclassified Corynebacterium]MCS4489997.1 ABC transporter substrate-binding protein [Corynebacterium sp. ES2775-CONJ]MCS4491640.1 ABC transporter substrate-binding protein [Corynebacterium sp. ES2715-CONJ3]MCS4531745.1 ABC transporter substrate-binding protein [Corynebacterium sp. ES2730-CONJ]MCU9519141.1 ABC transporter substrate-binding protein [Corynebacterium sp. ES2794-CONJ1]
MNRRGFLKAAGVMAAAAGIATTVSACGSDDKSDGNTSGSGSGSGGAMSKDEITAGISYELGTNGYDPMTTTSALTIAANWHTLEGLYEITPTPDRTVYAALADGDPKVSEDGKSAEVTLRDGAVFHNGEPVTTEDVVFSFERVLDESNNSLYASFIPFIEKVEAKDATTVMFTMKYPFTLVKERLSVVKIVPKASVEADSAAFDANPVGTGPWKMTDNGAASSQVVFTKFEDYTGPKPAKAAKMTWKILPDAATRTNAMESKSVMAIDSVPYLSLTQVQASSSVESVQGFGLLFIMFNNGENSAMKDLKNRRGVLYAIDIDKVIQTGMANQASPAKSFVQENHAAYKEASMVYSLDAAKATEHFAETGLKSVRMLVTNHDWVKGCTPIIKESLEAAGISVEFTELKSSDLYTQIASDDTWDIVIAPGDPSVFGADADLLMRWWYAGDTWTDGRMHWKGTDSYNKVQELLEKASQSSGDEQMDLWHQTFDLLSEEVPLYPLFHRKSPSAWNDDALDGFEPISLTGLSFVDVGLK